MGIIQDVGGGAALRQAQGERRDSGDSGLWTQKQRTRSVGVQGLPFDRLRVNGAIAVTLGYGLTAEDAEGGEYPLWIPAFAGMTGGGARRPFDRLRANGGCWPAPATQRQRITAPRMSVSPWSRRWYTSGRSCQLNSWVIMGSTWREPPAMRRVVSFMEFMRSQRSSFGR